MLCVLYAQRIHMHNEPTCRGVALLPPRQALCACRGKVGKNCDEVIMGNALKCPWLFVGHFLFDLLLLDRRTRPWFR